ncbi:helix-turn-helix domain-containing protein [Vreelandella aquamarina]|uniref:Putative transcriptional regulator n=1 Tax=Vreelandella aquamarina TaxID=77097 RepID=A0A1H8P2H1_9GAMM|nr:helix-turn-helix transcriptional regulator [Halomonas aquamarina]SEO36062.1 putative transcriptional regulator [Halomonas aquamarina]
MQAFFDALKYHMKNTNMVMVMLRFKIKEMLAKKEFSENRRITISEVAEATGIHRMTLSKMINHRGYNTGTENVDRLCEYFGCQVEDVIEYVPMSDKPDATG